MNLRIFLLILSTLLSQDKDVKGSEDHPLLSRYPGSVIRNYLEKDYDEFFLRAGPVESFVQPKGETLKVEGRLTRINYMAPAGRSALEVFKNYEKAIVGAGAEVIWSCSNQECGKGLAQALLTGEFRGEANLMGFNENDQRYLAAKLNFGGRQFYVSIFTVGAYSIGGPMKGRVFTQVDIVESKKIDEGLVTIDEARLKSSLEKEGKVVIYGIHFDFDSSKIKPESNTQLDEIAKALVADQKIYLVVGHTDNQGELDYNQRLSEERAKAVVDALVQRGIPRSRLIPVGVGMSAPVASNETEEGRAKNRRVELVRR
ncbi:MAG: DUF4892 domain-containing protein [Deltaproteobacteria bacterium]|nr:DUF4892 domain-containing protein [Deltaproteobacteria bacterium]